MLKKLCVVLCRVRSVLRHAGCGGKKPAEMPKDKVAAADGKPTVADHRMA